MHLLKILVETISEESAIGWWLRKYTGTDAVIYRRGRINKAGTPLYDTNWLPAQALIAVIYRGLGHSRGDIARLLGKSPHAVTDLFARVDRAERGCE